MLPRQYYTGVSNLTLEYLRHAGGVKISSVVIQVRGTTRHRQILRAVLDHAVSTAFRNPQPDLRQNAR